MNNIDWLLEECQFLHHLRNTVFNDFEAFRNFIGRIYNRCFPSMSSQTNDPHTYMYNVSSHAIRIKIACHVCITNRLVTMNKPLNISKCSVVLLRQALAARYHIDSRILPPENPNPRLP